MILNIYYISETFNFDYFFSNLTELHYSNSKKHTTKIYVACQNCFWDYPNNSQNLLKFFNSFDYFQPLDLQKFPYSFQKTVNNIYYPNTGNYLNLIISDYFKPATNYDENAVNSYLKRFVEEDGMLSFYSEKVCIRPPKINEYKVTSNAYQLQNATGWIFSPVYSAYIFSHQFLQKNSKQISKQKDNTYFDEINKYELFELIGNEYETPEQMEERLEKTSIIDYDELAKLSVVNF